MAGAIAGTAILKTDGKCDTLNTISLTINNVCNLHCGHCYLQYMSEEAHITDRVVNLVLSNDFRHLVIVGKEPLVNETSIEILCSITKKCVERNITVSFITNGLNLSRIPADIVPLFDYIDVSFDGGMESYKQYRKGNIFEIMNGIEYCLRNGLREVNALHTICDKTIDNVSECIRLKDNIPFKTILFTPYIVTDNQGYNEVFPLSLIDIIKRLDSNDDFINAHEASLLIDNYHIEQDGLNDNQLNCVLMSVRNQKKYLVYKDDPVFYGIIRVTYDGYILSPRQSLNTRLYRMAPQINANSNLNDLLMEMALYESMAHGN